MTALADLPAYQFSIVCDRHDTPEVVEWFRVVECPDGVRRPLFLQGNPDQPLGLSLVPKVAGVIVQRRGGKEMPLDPDTPFDRLDRRTTRRRVTLTCPSCACSYVWRAERLFPVLRALAGHGLTRCSLDALERTLLHLQ